MNGARCKAEIWDGFHPHNCKRSAVRDGFCKQHHPDATEARRRKREAKWNGAREAAYQATIERDRRTVRTFLTWVSAAGHPVTGLSEWVDRWPTEHKRWWSE